jgi:hypothetical protein
MNQLMVIEWHIFVCNKTRRRNKHHAPLTEKTSTGFFRASAFLTEILIEQSSHLDLTAGLKKGPLRRTFGSRRVAVPPDQCIVNKFWIRFS